MALLEVGIRDKQIIKLSNKKINVFPKKCSVCAYKRGGNNASSFKNDSGGNRTHDLLGVNETSSPLDHGVIRMEPKKMYYIMHMAE